MSARIAVITGTRAEYGLLHPLLEALAASPACDPRLIVTGTHLSDRFGMTVHEIEADGFEIAARVPLSLDDDSELGVAGATGAAVSGLAAALAAEKPALVVILGDRYEALAAATAATMLRIPIAHLHGGELTEGAIDDSIRHAITKLATLHFTSTEEYRRRVIQMGEDPDAVIATGALGVDNALHTPLLTSAQLAEQIGVEFAFPTALVTFHPVTHEGDSGAAQIDALLGAIDDTPELRVVFTLPNADAGNAAIRDRIEAWVATNTPRAWVFVSLGRVRYLSALAACDLVVGNSSSGIIEAPSFGKPVVDVGERQLGRVRASSVHNCAPKREAIAAAMARALSPEARASAALAANPYGDGHAAGRITSAIEAALAAGISARKRFHDVNFPIENGK